MRWSLPLSLFFAGNLSALNIQIDYTYDENNFFDTQEKKDAMQTVADFFGDLLQDNLLSIDPSEFSSNSTWTAVFLNPATGAQVQRTDLVIPEDTIIIFVGSRQLGGTVRGRGGPGGLGAGGFTNWVDRVIGRGQPGAEFRTVEAHLRTDFSLWGGTVAFDDDSNWNFSLEENESGVEFLKIALHEMGHALGIGTADSWNNLLANGDFTGSASTTANGGSAPAADSGHFLGTLTSPLYGSFGTTHGNVRPVLMLPSSNDNGSNFDVITDLDLAGLVDIGWEVALPTQLDAVALSPSGVTLSWPSSSFCDYEVIRSTDLQNPSGGSSIFTGDGSTQSWTDPSPEAIKAFYYLQATSSTAAKSAAPSKETKKAADKYEEIEIAPRFATGCYCEH